MKAPKLVCNLLLLMMATGAKAAPAPGRCTKDTDCPGAEICAKGACVAPGTTPTPTPPPLPSDSPQPPPLPAEPEEPTPTQPTPTQPEEPLPPPLPDTAKPRAAPAAPQPAAPRPPPAPRTTVVQPRPAQPPAPRAVTRRNGYWLVGSIASSVVAVGALVWGVTCTEAGKNAASEHDLDKFNTFQSQQKVAYGLAGALGAAGVTALILHFVTGEKTLEQPTAATGAGLSPGPGLAGLSGQWRF